MRMPVLATIFASILGFLSHLLPHTTPYADMIDRVSSSMVRIEGTKNVMTFEGPQAARYVCSGEVVGVGKVLTANHCLGEDMTADGVEVEKVVTHDEYYDLALLSVDTGQKRSLKFSDVPVQRFQDLAAIGYAFGLSKLTVLKATAILIDVSVWEDEDGQPGAPGLITQGGYVGGMSGGIVVNADGLIVGIIQQSNAGLGYGVSTVIIKAFLAGRM